MTDTYFRVVSQDAHFYMYFQTYNVPEGNRHKLSFGSVQCLLIRESQLHYAYHTFASLETDTE